MARRRGRPPKAEEEKIDRVSIMNLKGSQAFADWLEGFHRETGIPKMELARRAFALLAKHKKYPPPPSI